MYGCGKNISKGSRCSCQLIMVGPWKLWIDNVNFTLHCVNHRLQSIVRQFRKFSYRTVIGLAIFILFHHIHSCQFYTAILDTALLLHGSAKVNYSGLYFDESVRHRNRTCPTFVVKFYTTCVRRQRSTRISSHAWNVFRFFYKTILPEKLIPHI